MQQTRCPTRSKNVVLISDYTGVASAFRFCEKFNVAYGKLPVLFPPGTLVAVALRQPNYLRIEEERARAFVMASKEVITMSKRPRIYEGKRSNPRILSLLTRKLHSVDV